MQQKQGVSQEIHYFPSEQVLPHHGREEDAVSGLQLTFTATVQTLKGLPGLLALSGDGSEKVRCF